MKTALEMYQYCIDNKFGSGFNKKWGEKHFRIIENSLQPGEEVLMTFIGLHNYVSMTKHDDNCAYAITNKRLIIGQKKLVGEFLKVILLEMLNDVTYKSGLTFGIITFDTVKETFNVCLDKNQASNILQKIHDIVFANRGSQSIPMVDPSSGGADEIRKYKQLLDEGIISAEEFETKKKQLLGI